MIQKRSLSVKSLLICISAVWLILFASLSFAATTIRVPADQFTIEAEVNAASVGDRIIIENYQSEIGSHIQIINGKAVELLSEELYLNQSNGDNCKKTRTLLRVGAERPVSEQAKVTAPNESDGSCPFPLVPPGVAPTLVERQHGSEQANFYVWAAGASLYVNIDPVTSGFEMLIWADETFSVTQDGFKREVFLVDCNGQMYDHDIVVFASQTFELLDDPEWTGAPFDPTRVLTVGFSALNGDNYSWDVGTGTPVVIPPVPPGVAPTLVERQHGSEQANFYVWAAGGSLYVNIDPVTSGFEMLIWADETFSVTQDGFKREVFLVDCNGQMYDDDIVVFASQTFKLLDDPEWTGAPFDPTRVLTVGFSALNGDNYSWDVGTGTPVVIPPVPPGVTPTLVERQHGSEQANFYVWAAGGSLYVNIDPVTSGFEMLIWADETFSVTQDGFKREVFLVDCNGQMYDDDIVVFASQTFKLLDDPEWTGAPFDPTRVLTVGFSALNGDNYSWDVEPIVTISTIITSLVTVTK